MGDKDNANTNLGITFGDIHSDEPHEEVVPSDTEDIFEKKNSHLSSHGKVFNVKNAMDEEESEEGTIVSDRKRHHQSFGESLADAFDEWTDRTKKKLSLIKETVDEKIPKEEDKKVGKPEERKETIERAAKHSILPPQKTPVKIEKVKTFNKDFEDVSGNPIKIKEPPKVEKPTWGYTKEETPPTKIQKVKPISMNGSNHSLVAPVVRKKIQKPISDYTPKQTEVVKPVEKFSSAEGFKSKPKIVEPQTFGMVAPVITPDRRVPERKEVPVAPKDIPTPPVNLPTKQEEVVLKDRVQEAVETATNKKDDVLTHVTQPEDIANKQNNKITVSPIQSKPRWDSEMVEKFDEVVIPDHEMHFDKGRIVPPPKPISAPKRTWEQGHTPTPAPAPAVAPAQEPVSVPNPTPAPQPAQPQMTPPPRHHFDTPERPSIPLNKQPAPKPPQPIPVPQPVETPAPEVSEPVAPPQTPIPQTMPQPVVEKKAPEPVEVPLKKEVPAPVEQPLHSVPQPAVMETPVTPPVQRAPVTVSRPNETQAPLPQTSKNTLRIMIIGGSIVAIVVIVLVVAFLMWNMSRSDNSAPNVPLPDYRLPVSSFIETPAQTTIPLTGNRSAFIASFNTLVRQADRTVPVTEIIPTVIEGDEVALASSAELFAFLEARVPTSLVRVITDDYMIGAAQGGTSEPFIMLRSYNFDVFFTSMLAWERTLADDLAPLMNNIEDTDGNFKDAVRGNASTRILYDENGNELLLYSFVNNNTVIITTTSDALSVLIREL